MRPAVLRAFSMALSLVLVLVLGCRRQVRIQPGDVVLRPGGSVQLKLVCEKAPPGSTWSWSLGPGGQGQVDDHGRYTAPEQPGTWVVEVRNTLRPRLHAKVRVRVLALKELVHVPCNIAGGSFTLCLQPLPGNQAMFIKSVGLPPEILDPAQGRVCRTTMPVMVDSAFTFTPLPGGNLFVCGDSWQSDQVPPTYVFVPATGMWMVGLPLLYRRQGHTATVLPDGRVLIVGGRTRDFQNIQNLVSAEIFDPTNGARCQVGDLCVPRSGHSAIPLRDGRVLIAGGQLTWARPDGELPMEIFDPVTSRFSPVPPTPGGAIAEGTTGAQMGDGEVLLVAPSAFGKPGGATLDVLDLATGVIRGHPSAFAVRVLLGLPDGSILLLGDHRVAILDPGHGEVRALEGNWFPSTTHVKHARLEDGRILLWAGNDCYLVQ